MNREDRIRELEDRRRSMLHAGYIRLQQEEARRKREELEAYVKEYRSQYAYPSAMKGLPEEVAIKTFEMKYGTPIAKEVAQYLGVKGLDFSAEARAIRAGSPPKKYTLMEEKATGKLADD